MGVAWWSGRKRLSWRAPVLVAALALAAAAPASPRGAADESCPSGVRCLTVQVPVDRSGRVPGTISLKVQVLAAEGVAKGAMFLLAGGPGQAALEVFDLGDEAKAPNWRSIFEGYTLVTYDVRGTGASDPLRCPMLKGRYKPSDIAACAQLIGPKRDFYGTPDHAEDLDAVRAALGYDSISLFGGSYGTRLALAYALAHPSRVDRLVLDSVAPPAMSAGFVPDIIGELPNILRRFCSQGACRQATPDFVSDLAAVANRLAAKPAHGSVREPGGGHRTQRLDGDDLITIAAGVGSNSGFAAELPAAIHAARLGDDAPLLRLVDLAYGDPRAATVPIPGEPMRAATICRDGPFPWQPDTPLAERPALLRSAVEALPAGALGPFGPWAARSGLANFCLGWPSPEGGSELGTGPYPDVPTLMLAGDIDAITPLAYAASLVHRFPHGHLLVVPGVGHSVITSDPVGCTRGYVRAWLRGQAIPGRCPTRRAFRLRPLAAFGEGGASPAGPQQTLKIAARTLREAEATWRMVGLYDGARVAGLRSGTLRVHPWGFSFERYGSEPGVTITGAVFRQRSTPSLVFSGAVTVDGPRGAPGELELLGDRLSGTLGGDAVSMRGA